MTPERLQALEEAVRAYDRLGDVACRELFAALREAWAERDAVRLELLSPDDDDTDSLVDMAAGVVCDNIQPTARLAEAETRYSETWAVALRVLDELKKAGTDETQLPELRVRALATRLARAETVVAAAREVTAKGPGAMHDEKCALYHHTRWPCDCGLKDLSAALAEFDEVGG